MGNLILANRGQNTKTEKGSNFISTKMARSKSPQRSSPSPIKQKTLPTFGVQLFSSKKSDPKKYLVTEDGKKIWRDERLLTEASKNAFLAKLLKSKAAWLKQMSENDLPSCPDTDEEDSGDDLKLESPRSSINVESRLSRAAGKILGLSPKKEQPKTGAKRKLTYSAKATSITSAKNIKRTPTLNFKPESPRSLESSPNRLSPVKPTPTSPTKTPAEKRPPLESDTVFSSIKKLFTFNKVKAQAAKLPLEIVDDDGQVNARNIDLDWQTQGI